MERKISGYPNYTISDSGDIRNIKRGRVLKTTPRKDGYVIVMLYNGGESRAFYVHRLVLRAFVGISANQANHINGDKSDNVLSNLEYCTAKQNTIHAHRTGLVVIKKETYEKIAIANRKVGAEDALKMKKMSANGLSFRSIGKFFNVHHKTVSGIVNQLGSIRARPDNRNKEWMQC